MITAKKVAIAEIVAVAIGIITMIWSRWGGAGDLAQMISDIILVTAIVTLIIFIIVVILISIDKNKMPHIKFIITADNLRLSKPDEENEVIIFSPLMIENNGADAHDIKSIIKWDEKEETYGEGKLPKGETKNLLLNAILFRIPEGKKFNCTLKYDDEITFNKYYSKIIIKRGEKVSDDRYLLMIDDDSYEYGFKPFYKRNYIVKKMNLENNYLNDNEVDFHA